MGDTKMAFREFSYIEKYITQLLELAKAKQIRFAVLSGITRGSLDWTTTDVDVLCEDDSDVERMRALAFSLLRSDEFKTHIQLITLHNKHGGFQMVFASSNEGMTMLHMLDCFHKLYYEQLVYLDGVSYFRLLEAGYSPKELVNIIKNVNKSKNPWPRAPQELIVLRSVKPSSLSKIFFYGRKIARYLLGFLKPRRGLFVVLLGLDGSGKTSIILSLKRSLDGVRNLLPVSTFHWCPAIGLSRAQKIIDKPVAIPHKLAARGTVLSVLKLIYIALKCNIGYFFRLRPLLVRNGIVLADRYYHDLLVDPQRYRYGGPLWLVKFVQAFIPKPDIFILVDVPGEVALSRKQEISLDAAHTLRKKYMELVHGMPNTYIVDAQKSLDEVVREVEGIILRSMADHTIKRYIDKSPATKTLRSS